MEVFDGRPDPDDPDHFDKEPLIHPDEGMDLEGGCLMFSGKTVFVADSEVGADGWGRRVRRVGRWDPHDEKVVGEPPEPNERSTAA